MEFKGKTVLVTGGSRGIGAAIAQSFAAKGATIALNYAGSQEAAEEIREKILAMGVECKIYQGDVSDFSQVENMIKTVEEDFSGIDILVNNAGVTKDSLFMRMKEEDWDKVIDTNLKGVYNCSKSVIRGMIKRKFGKIINITSVVALSGNIGQANYAASKAGVIGFTKSLAQELGSRNIQVNSVAPGYIETSMTESIPQNIKDELIKKIPSGRIGSPDDVANAVVFLASDKANYITGQVISVNGGLYM
ncbi:MAG: 3-oxoacyl-[acyl-carrier-protein] reductase [Eubacteriales bacterium]|nr:3-oxoacyl-[acyl-carrier-protein] reductase [Eubacteriales bacterium]